jgi:hypothetical protein
MTPDDAQLPWDSSFDSTNINRIAFLKDDPEDYGTEGHGTLYVEFSSGSIYRYLHVSYQHHTELLDAPSVGGYLNSEIKPIYDYERVEVLQ